MDGIAETLYQGIADRMALVMRVAHSPGGLRRIRGEFVCREVVVGAFRCEAPRLAEDGATFTGPIVFHGPSVTFGGTVALQLEPNGRAAVQVLVDWEDQQIEVFSAVVHKQDQSSPVCCA